MKTLDITKFKAKTHKGETVYGFPVWHDVYVVTMHAFGCDLGDIGVEVDPFSIRQFSGLFDSLLQELYYGDTIIVEYGEKKKQFSVTHGTKHMLEKYGGVVTKK